MIDEKKIEEAAFMHTHKNQTWNEKRDYANAFKHGVEWFKINLWHDVSERPPRYDTYLVRTKQGCLDFCHFATEKWHSKDIGIVEKWLDLADIKPKGGEQCM